MAVVVVVWLCPAIAPAAPSRGRPVLSLLLLVVLVVVLVLVWLSPCVCVAVVVERSADRVSIIRNQCINQPLWFEQGAGRQYPNRKPPSPGPGLNRSSCARSVGRRD